MTNKIYKECKGCLLTISDEVNCPSQDIKHTYCPCSKCIVKMICEDDCDEFKRISEQIKTSKLKKSKKI